MREHRRLTAAAGVGALAAGLLAVAPAAQGAPSSSAAVIINEVYGGGGNTGATLNRDFVELVNVSSAPVDVSAWSVQYASAAGTTWQTTPLVGTIPPGATYVVGEGLGGNQSTTTVVTVDVDGAIPMSGTSAKVALVSSTTALSGCGDACSDLPAVVDFVGWGTANDWAGSAPAVATSNTASIERVGDHQNTPDNATDFARVSPPTPSACGEACVGGEEPPPGPEVVSIAEIQGTGPASARAGQEVTTHGVVTATYPTSGFRGFYLQTEGTGGAHDLAGPSHGIFVYQGTGALDADAQIGNYVEVTGVVDEYFGLTRLEADAADIADAGDGFDPVTAVASGWPGSDAERESLEGMLFRPTGAFTVTNTFGTNQYGEVGLASGTKPLIQPTEVVEPGKPLAGTPIKAVIDDNAARKVTLDDGASTNFTASSYSTRTCGERPLPCLLNGDVTPAYVSNDEPVRVGAAAEFTDDVIVDYRFDLWRFQPTEQVVGPENVNAPATFENTRTDAPDEENLGDAELKVASFNVLNYFTTLGSTVDGCLAYYDRDDNGTNTRTGCDPRGAWDAADLARQQEKIVAAINALDADVVGLMEIENSAALGEQTDEALATLVSALNADAGAGTWDFVPSSSELPPASEQDVITNAIIYKPAHVMRVDQSRALGDQSAEGQAFGNAREPIAQVFKNKYGKGDKFLFVVNHFKSKGSPGPHPGDEDTGDGQGTSVTSRILQAQALRDWIPEVTEETSTSAVILAGDFNSYTMEDPLDVLYDAGYVNATTHFGLEEYSYSFQGLSGSLDHILLNDDALALATGVDIWNINSGESVALEYSRFNYHATNFHRPDVYRSSDHDPVVLGLRAYATKE